MERLGCVVIVMVYGIARLVGALALDSWNVDDRQRVLS